MTLLDMLPYDVILIVLEKKAEFEKNDSEMYFYVRGGQIEEIERMLTLRFSPEITEKAICASLSGLSRSAIRLRKEIVLLKYLLALPGAPAASGQMLLTVVQRAICREGIVAFGACG